MAQAMVTLPQRPMRAQAIRSPSPEITFMYPYFTPEEIAGGRMVSPDIIVMVPSPTTREPPLQNPIAAHMPVVN
jgi:hypothetical protein